MAKAKKRGSHLQKPVKISTALAQVIGKGPHSRPQIMKKIWAYIKRKDLQHPKHRRYVCIDEKLATLFKPSKGGPKGCIIMFEMTKQLSKHIESSKVKVKGNPSSIGKDMRELEDLMDFSDDDDDDFDDYEDDDEDYEDDEDY